MLLTTNNLVGELHVLRHSHSIIKQGCGYGRDEPKRNEGAGTGNRLTRFEITRALTMDVWRN